VPQETSATLLKGLTTSATDAGDAAALTSC